MFYLLSRYYKDRILYEFASIANTTISVNSESYAYTILTPFIYNSLEVNLRKIFGPIRTCNDTYKQNMCTQKYSNSVPSKYFALICFEYLQIMLTHMFYEDLLVSHSNEKHHFNKRYFKRCLSEHRVYKDKQTVLCNVPSIVFMSHSLYVHLSLWKQ